MNIVPDPEGSPGESYEHQSKFQKPAGDDCAGNSLSVVKSYTRPHAIPVHKRRCTYAFFKKGSPL